MDIHPSNVHFTIKGNLNSQSTVGSGNMQAGASRYTGTLDQKGLIYGSVSEIETDSSEDIKLFGLEDLWGEHWTFVECIFSYYDYIEVVKDPSRDDLILSEYDVTVHDSGFIDDAVCSPELGFFPTKYDGSGTTYFCDVGNISNAGDCAVGSQYSNSTNSPGIFCIYSDFTGSSSARDSTLGARLSYY